MSFVVLSHISVELLKCSFRLFLSYVFHVQIMYNAWWICVSDRVWTVNSIQTKQGKKTPSKFPQTTENDFGVDFRCFFCLFEWKLWRARGRIVKRRYSAHPAIMMYLQIIERTNFQGVINFTVVGAVFRPNSQVPLHTQALHNIRLNFPDQFGLLRWPHKTFGSSWPIFCCSWTISST